MYQNCRLAREVVQKSRETFSAISHYRLRLSVSMNANVKLLMQASKRLQAPSGMDSSLMMKMAFNLHSLADQKIFCNFGSQPILAKAMMKMQTFSQISAHYVMVQPVQISQISNYHLVFCPTHHYHLHQHLRYVPIYIFQVICLIL